jgi:NADH-quinone oxidoreductase subunit M
MVRLGVPPLHSWLPTMSETLPAGTMLALTSVQMAVHVMVDWALVPLPAAVPAESALVTGVGLVGVVYASIVALSHSRLRRLVAFVTIAQSCALLVGLATGSQVGVSGAMTNALSVATTGRGLLLAVAAIESRTGLVDTRQLSGLAHTAPRLATVAILLALAMAGLPGSLGFVGEDLLLQSLLERHPVVAAILVACTALTSIALLRAVLKTCFGPAPAWVHGLPDLFPRERALVGLAVLLFLWGLFPAPWVSAHQSDIQRLMAQHQDTSAPALIRTTSTPGLPPEPTGPTPLRAFHETRHPPHAGILRRHSGRDFPE